MGRSRPPRLDREGPSIGRQHARREEERRWKRLLAEEKRRGPDVYAKPPAAFCKYERKPAQASPAAAPPTRRRWPLYVLAIALLALALAVVNIVLP